VQRWLLALLLVLPACRNKDDSATGGDTGPSDADSDGLIDDGDCDDSSGAIKPGAASYPGHLEGYGGPNTRVWQTLWVL
jgi:hypothetical protein